MSRAANASSSADHLPRRVLAAGAAGAGGASPQGGAASASDGARSRLRVAARRGASGAATSGLAVSVSRFSSSDSVSTGAMTGTALSTSIGDPVSSPSQVTLRCSVAGCSMATRVAVAVQNRGRSNVRDALGWIVEVLNAYLNRSPKPGFS